jgi:hypothetical protein
MRLLRAHHIKNLIEVVDTFLPRAGVSPYGGRPVKLHTNEAIALLLFSSMAAPQRTLSGIYHWAQVHYYRRFQLPAYSSWMRKCRQALPGMLAILDQLLVKDSWLRFMDSTMLRVSASLCVPTDTKSPVGQRPSAATTRAGTTASSSMRVSTTAAGLPQSGFTGANESDVLQLKQLVNTATNIVVGDAGYTAKVTRRHLWRDFRCLVISPPRPKQLWTMANWQHKLLQLRPKIEAVFGKLKEHYFLVSSFPRSVQGYALHYVRTLLGYQMKEVS